MESSSVGPDRTTRPLAAVLALLVAGQVFLLWLPRYLPTQDGPAHLYSAWVSRQLADHPGDPLSKWFTSNPKSIYPNAGYSEFLEFCAGFMPIQKAERLALSLYFAALPLAVGLFARSFGRDPILPAYFASGLSFSWIFFLGFFNFLWGVPVAFLFLSVVRRTMSRPTIAGIAGANLLLALTFWCHLVAFGAALVAAGVLALATRRIWTGIASALPVVLLSPLFWPRTVGLETHWKWKHALAVRVTDALTLSIGSAFGPPERALAVGVGFFVLVAAVWSLRRVREGRLELALLAGAFFLGAVAAPDAIGSGSWLPARLTLFAWLVLGATIDLGRGAARAIAASLFALAILAHGVFIEHRLREFDRTMADFMSGVELIPKSESIYARIRVPKEQHFVVRPMATVHNYYSMELATPDLEQYQAMPENAPQFPIGYTTKALKFALSESRSNQLSKRILSGWADYIVLWDPMPHWVVRLTTESGYRVLATRGGLTVLVHARIARPVS